MADTSSLCKNVADLAALIKMLVCVWGGGVTLFRSHPSLTFFMTPSNVLGKKVPSITSITKNMVFRLQLIRKQWTKSICVECPRVKLRWMLYAPFSMLKNDQNSTNCVKAYILHNNIIGCWHEQYNCKFYTIQQRRSSSLWEILHDGQPFFTLPHVATIV